MHDALALWSVSHTDLPDFEDYTITVMMAVNWTADTLERLTSEEDA